MHIFGKTVEEWNNMGREFRGSFVKLSRERVDLFFGGDFGSEEEPNERFEEGFSVTGFA